MITAEVSENWLHFSDLGFRYSVAKALGFEPNQRLNGGHSTAMNHHGNTAPESKATG